MNQSGSTKQVAAVYLLLAGLQRGVSFLILPFISRVMSPAEYGAASVLTTSTLLLVAVFAPLEILIFRAVARDEIDGAPLLRAAGLYCYVIFPIAFALPSAAVALFVPRLFGTPGYIWGIELLAVGFMPAASSFALPAVRARQNLRLFALLALASVMATAISKLVLIVLLRLGVLGWAISDLFSAVVSACLAVALVRLPRVRVESHHVRDVAAFCLPLIPHRASFWALSSLSRPTLAIVSSLAEVGLLAFGSNLASVAFLILTELNQAVQPHYARESFPIPSDETRSIVRWQLVLTLTVPAVVGAGLAVVGPWMFDEAFWHSFALTGILLCGQVAFGFYAILTNYLVLTAGLARSSSIASVPGALIIVVGIFMLGPSYGALGVAYSTALGFFAMAALALLLTRFLKVDIRWRSWAGSWPELTVGILGMACSVAALSWPPASMVATGFALAALALSLAAVGITSAHHRRGVL